MIITQFSASYLRSLNFISFSPSKQLNILLGRNNDGKTSVLEGIFFASTLKSFKSVKPSSLIQYDSSSVKVLLNVHKFGENSTISIKKGLKGPKSLKINDKSSSVKDSMLFLPILALNFGAENIVSGSSDDRRALLDWGVFHVEQTYLTLFKDYHKTLKHRNKMLKSKNIDSLEYWTKQLSEKGEQLNALREKYFKQLCDCFNEYKDSVVRNIPDIYADIKNTAISYNKGWPKNLSLENAMMQTTDKDIVLKYTTMGPHRSDILFASNNHDLKDSASMSTQIITSLLLMLSQCRVFHVEHKYNPILLIDDLFFGIDDKNLSLVINLLKESNAQSFITAPDLYKSKIEEVAEGDPMICIYEFKDKNLQKHTK